MPSSDFRKFRKSGTKTIDKRTEIGYYFLSMVPEIDVRRCLARGIRAGETEFEWEGAEELLEIPFVHFAAPVRFSLRYELGEDGCADVEGTLSFMLEGSCSRCLEEAKETFESRVEGRFSPAPAEEDDYPYRNGKIDLNDFVRDCVLVALPPVLHCDRCAEED